MRGDSNLDEEASVAVGWLYPRAQTVSLPPDQVTGIELQVALGQRVAKIGVPLVCRVAD